MQRQYKISENSLFTFTNTITQFLEPGFNRCKDNTKKTLAWKRFFFTFATTVHDPWNRFIDLETVAATGACQRLLQKQETIENNKYQFPGF